MAWLGPLREFVLAKSNSRHRVPGVANVARGPPKVSADIRAPFPNIQAAILAEAVDDRTFRLQQRVTHDLIDRRRSEEHTSELQSPCNLVCRLLPEKKKTHK